MFSDADDGEKYLLQEAVRKLRDTHAKCLKIKCVICNVVEAHDALNPGWAVDRKNNNLLT
jgi:hypothetical protein